MYLDVRDFLILNARELINAIFMVFIFALITGIYQLLTKIVPYISTLVICSPIKGTKAMKSY